MPSLNLLEPNSSPCEGISPEVRTPVEGTSSVPAVRVRKRARRSFPDLIYPHAAELFQAAQVEKPLSLGLIRYAPTSRANGQDVPSEDKRHELWAYELAFNTLTFQELLEDLLLDSCFIPSQHMPDDLMALVLVMMYDLQDRKFKPREAVGEVLIEEVRMVEDSLFRFRTKLAASLARYRIKHGLLSIHCMLTKNMREKHQRRHKVPLCAWVNTLKMSVEDVCDRLKAEGFVHMEPHTHLEESEFCMDTYCHDVLLFPQSAEEQLERTSLVKENTLIIQEKSRSLAASAVRPLLVKDADVLMVGSFSAQTVAHVAVLASACSAHLYVCGMPEDSTHWAELETALSAFGCQNVELLPNDFGEINKWDSRMQKVRVILLLPQCTSSALSNPVAHILHEDGDRELLQELSQDGISNKKLDLLVAGQNRDLSHALTFPKVQAVIYCTCSVYAEENEQLVKRALENRSVKAKQPPFKIVSTGWMEEDEENFFLLEATDSADGCFICVLKREQEQPEPESVQDILARAVARGLLTGLYFPEPPDQANQKTKKKGKRKGAGALPPLVPTSTEDNKLVNNPGIINSKSETFPEPNDVHSRTLDSASLSPGALKASLKSALHDSSNPLQSSCDSLTALNEYSDAVNDDSPVSGLTGRLGNGTKGGNDAANQKSKARKRKSKAPMQTRLIRTKSKSQTRAKRGSRKRSQQRTQRRTKVRTRTLTTLTARVPPLMPAPPHTKTITTSRSSNDLPKLPGKRKGQLEALTVPQEVLSPRLEMEDLNETLKLKQEVDRYGKEVMFSMRGLLPPISSRSPAFRSSASSFRLPQYSASSSSTGSFLSSLPSTPSSRSESRNSVLSRTRTWQ